MTETILWIIGITALLFAVIYMIVMGFVLGQDFDQRYACLYKDQHPFKEMCYNQQLATMFDRLLNRTQEWNNTH